MTRTRKFTSSFLLRAVFVSLLTIWINTSSAQSAAPTLITLESDSISIEGPGAVANGSLVTIQMAGTYSLSGTLNDGQILVEAGGDENVVLILNQVDISSFTSAPIYVLNADKTTITLSSGTENYVTDGNSYILDGTSDEPNAAIFSKDDLGIDGSGALIVNANYNNGIASKNDLKISGGGNIIVNAVNDGIKGKDSIEISGETFLTIVAGSDGVQSHNTDDPERGYVSIADGFLDIISGSDGIKAATNIIIMGGEINVTSGAKGLKADIDISIEGGSFQFDSSDDAIHSNGAITINGGQFALATGDDAIHAKATVTINGGAITITESYEGIEGAMVTINGGDIHITATDDGINSSGGGGGDPSSSEISRPPLPPGGGEGGDVGPHFCGGGGVGEAGDMPPLMMDGDVGGMPPPMMDDNAAKSSNSHISINGGYIYIASGADGLDSNGNTDITGGTILINGPTTEMEGALDADLNFTVSGGFLIAVGSSQMAQSPSSISSTQYSVLYIFDSVQLAGTMVHVEDSETGEKIFTFVPTKEFQSVAFSSAALRNGATYKVFLGGTAEGPSVDGLYEGLYTPGTEEDTFTISSIVTGESDGQGGGGGKPPCEGVVGMTGLSDTSSELKEGASSTSGGPSVTYMLVTSAFSLVLLLSSLLE